MATAAPPLDRRQFLAPALALVKRELLVPSRTRSALVILLVLLLIGAWIVFANYPRGEVAWGYLSTSATMIVLWLTVFLIIGVAVIVPAVAATAILGERNAGNWDSLALTLIRPSWIVLAKLFCVVARYLILVAALAPLYASALFLIGFDWRQILSLITLLAATTLTCAAMGLGCSALFRSMTRAMLASYAFMMMLMGLPLVLLVIFVAIRGGAGGFGAWLQQNAWGLSPLAVLAGFVAGGTGFVHFFWHLAYQAAYILIGLLMTWIGIRRAREPEHPSPKPVKAADRFPIGATYPDTPRWFQPHANPIYQREVRWGAGFNKRRAVVAIPLGFVYFGGVTATMLALIGNDGQSHTQELAFTIFLHGASLCCVVPALFANSFTKERDRKNCDMLHSTLMTPEEIVGGKFRAAMMFFAAMWLISFLGNAPVWLGRPDPTIYRWTGIMGHGTILVAGLFSVAITLRFAVRVKHTATAIFGGQILVLATNVGVVLLLALFIDKLQLYRSLLTDYVPVVLFTSPSMSFFVWLDRSMDSFPFLAYWFSNTLIFTGITYLIYRSTVRHYAKYQIQEP